MPQQRQSQERADSGQPCAVRGQQIDLRLKPHHERKESGTQKKPAEIGLGIKVMVEVVSAAHPHPPLFHRPCIGQIADHQPSPRFENAMKLLQRLVVHGNVFQDAGCDDGIELSIRIGELERMRQLPILQSGIAKEIFVLVGIDDVASVQGNRLPEPGANQARIRCVVASPIEDGRPARQARFVEPKQPDRTREKSPPECIRTYGSSRTWSKYCLYKPCRTISRLFCIKSGLHSTPEGLHGGRVARLPAGGKNAADNNTCYQLESGIYLE